MAMYPLPKINTLPDTLPDDGSINLSLDQGSPVFHASTAVQERIEDLLYKQQMGTLTQAEEEELDQYEEIDDYLSHLNRVVRNIQQEQNH